jgi:hypothetical protein
MLAESPQMLKTSSHRLLWVDTDNRHIISMKSRGFPQTPQDIMAEYNGCSVPQYTAYRRVSFSSKGVQRVATS